MGGRGLAGAGLLGLLCSWEVSAGVASGARERPETKTQSLKASGAACLILWQVSGLRAVSGVGSPGCGPEDPERLGLGAQAPISRN